MASPSLIFTPTTMVPSRSNSFSDGSPQHSPRLYAQDTTSTSALILVQDAESDLDDNDSSNMRRSNSTPFELSSDEDNEEDLTLSSPFLSSSRAGAEPLSEVVVILYLLTPYLKLGAMLIPDTQLPLKYGLPSLFLFAILTAFSRQIWYMLARYFCTVDFEKVVLDVLAKGGRKERTREILRSMTRAGTASLRVLLAAVYLRESVHHLSSMLPDVSVVPTRPLLAAFITLLILPFSTAKSIGYKRVIFVTFLSIVTYIIWLSLTSFTYSKGFLTANSSWLRMGAFWQGITTIAFTFASSSTLNLYASLRVGAHNLNSSVATKKTPKTRSFRSLSLFTVTISLVMTLPLMFFAAFPNEPSTEDLPNTRVQHASAFLFSSTLLLAIPSIVVSSPLVPIPRIFSQKAIFLSRVLTTLIVFFVSLVPGGVYGVLCDILLACAFSATYFLPALLHIGTHFLRRPLSIIMPSTPNPFTPAFPDHDDMPNSANDPLLQRKEHALRRKQLRRRIVWDIGVWVVVVPLCMSGIVWAGGRLARRW